MSTIFWIIVMVGTAFGILDYRGDPNDHRWGYLTWLAILAAIILIGLRVFGMSLHLSAHVGA